MKVQPAHSAASALRARRQLRGFGSWANRLRRFEAWICRHGLLYGLSPGNVAPGEFHARSSRTLPIKTWDGTWTYHPKVVAVTPESVEDLVEILSDEVRFPAPVRPAGSMHSTARMNGDEEGGTMVDMKAMNRILHFTGDTVTVEAGVTYLALAQALKERGITALRHDRDRQRHAWRHGDRRDQGQLLPRRLRSGQFLRNQRAPGHARRQAASEINDRDNPDEMQIIRSSYGLFGIVYEVTIKVRLTTALSPCATTR